MYKQIEEDPDAQKRLGEIKEASIRNGFSLYLKSINPIFVFRHFEIWYYYHQYIPAKNTQLHHLDFNSHNNCPSNIIAVDKKLHRYIHQQETPLIRKEIEKLQEVKLCT
jgi:hypothetical protein